MQYKVPQNVDIEDKVIAGLTLRQFGFLMTAAGIALVLKFVLVDSLSFLFFPAAAICAGIGIALAFVKINDRPFEMFLIAASKTVLTPGKRYWEKDQDFEIPKHTETKHTREAVKTKRAIKDVRTSLERLATVVDSGGTAEVLTDISRTTNIIQAPVQDSPLVKDIMENTEQPQEHLDKYLNDAKQYVNENRKEQPVSSIATPGSDQDNFEYEKLELADENKLKQILEKAEEKQKVEDDNLHDAKIMKFKHDEIK